MAAAAAAAPAPLPRSSMSTPLPGTAANSVRILVIEDEKNARDALLALLQADGHDVRGVESGEDALALADDFAPDVALVDIKLPGMSGLDLIPQLKEHIPECICVVMTAFSSVESAVDAMRRGAEDYLVKPLNPDELELVLARELRHQAVRLEAKHLRERAALQDGVPGMVGASHEMQEVYRLIARAAPARASVLITGESGTGKELVARALHHLSPRKDKPFVAVNCAALPDTLIESELFGYEKGAFTGAVGRKIGRFELADGGTLFLDEIGDLPPLTQVKLLRVLQERTFERVGGTQTIGVDVRVIAATNKDLASMVQTGEYRDDLYFRLNVVTIDTPSLRTRRSDIPLLWEHFVRRYAEEEAKPGITTDPEVMLALYAYDWPGNVRELENVAEHAVVMCPGDRILPDHLPERLGGGRGSSDPLTIRVPGMTLDEVETATIIRTWEACERSTHRTAEALGISVRKIQYRLKSYREAGLVD